MRWLGYFLIGIALLALLLRAKVRSMSIYQNDAYAGSALGGLIDDKTGLAYFVTVRTAPNFDIARPFRHQGVYYRLVSWGSVDDRSPVLKRHMEAWCEVVG